MTDPHWFPLVLMALSLAAATLVSEDLTCVGAGVLVATGRLSFPVAVAGCLIGIVAGDVFLMLGGRWLGRHGLHRPFARRFVSAEALARSAQWMHDRGAIVVALSRFVPGTRLATYVTAGALGIGVWRFTSYVTLTALLWVPWLVGVSAIADAGVVEARLSFAGTWATGGLVAAIALGVTFHVAKWCARWTTRRRLYGLWRRWTRWEFWPMWAFYPPLLAYIAYLMFRHRSLTVFTAANPDIPAGGLIGESKFDILRGLAGSGRVARAALVPSDLTADRRAGIVRSFMERERLTFPIVVKPDVGQRGTGVTVVRDESALDDRLGSANEDLIVQEYVPGLEFGVFYCRRPSATRGRILSITDKQFPAVRGDGHSTLHTLILADDRAVALERVHRRVHDAQLSRVPACGEVVPLVEIGSHCRGALFLDAGHLASQALEQAFDDLAKPFGFFFGRFDVRTESVEAFAARGEFQVLELNGVTSESTHIYDPRHGLTAAYRDLARQWRLAFEIGAENCQRGARATPLVETLRMVIDYRRRRRSLTTRGNARLNAQVPA